jgi:hypothetical protein
VGPRTGRPAVRAVAVAVAVVAVVAVVAAALVTVGTAAAPASGFAPPATRAARYLERAQNRDGGLGAAPGSPSAALYSGWAAIGLAADGVDVARLRAGPGRPSLLGYVRTDARAADPGSLERTIIALGAGGDHAGARQLLERLRRSFSRGGSVEGLVDLTSFGLLALRATGARSTAELQARAAGWLAGRADRDGGYGYAGRGSGSDADDTGAVLEAFGARPGAAVARARRRAVAWLRRDQDRDGGFPAAPGAGSNAQSTAWAIQGLIAAGIPPASLHRNGHTPSGYLVSLMAPSGAVRYSRDAAPTPVWVTAEALAALAGAPLPIG